MNRVYAEVAEPRFILGPCKNAEVVIRVDATKHDCTIVLPAISRRTNSFVTVEKIDSGTHHVIIKIDAINEGVMGYREWRLWQSGQSTCIKPADSDWYEAT